MVYVKTENIPSFPTLCLLNYLPPSLIRVRNSSRDLGSSLRAPSIQLVTVLLLGFCTPRITIHMCLIIKRNSFINQNVYNTMSGKVFFFFKKRVFSNIYQFLKLRYNFSCQYSITNSHWHVCCLSAHKESWSISSESHLWQNYLLIEILKQTLFHGRVKEQRFFPLLFNLFFLWQ